MNPGEKRNPQLHDQALLSLYIGMRAGEIFNLIGQDLDLENNIINNADPKNGETRKAYMATVVRTMLFQRKPLNPSALVFKDRKGQKQKAVSAVFKRTVDAL